MPEVQGIERSFHLLLSRALDPSGNGPAFCDVVTPAGYLSQPKNPGLAGRGSHLFFVFVEPAEEDWRQLFLHPFGLFQGEIAGGERDGMLGLVGSAIFTLLDFGDANFERIERHDISDTDVVVGA